MLKRPQDQLGEDDGINERGNGGGDVPAEALSQAGCGHLRETPHDGDEAGQEHECSRRIYVSDAGGNHSPSLGSFRAGRPRAQERRKGTNDRVRTADSKGDDAAPGWEEKHRQHGREKEQVPRRVPREHEGADRARQKKQESEEKRGESHARISTQS